MSGDVDVVSAGVFHKWRERRGMSPADEFEMWVGLALYALARARLVLNMREYDELIRLSAREQRPNVFTRGGRNIVDLLIMEDAEKVLEILRKKGSPK